MSRPDTSSPSPRAGLLVLLVSVIALFAIGVVRTVPRLEKELASASRKALAAQGIAASVVFDGQDASVSSEVHDAATST
jgi:hypothetical protein